MDAHEILKVFDSLGVEVYVNDSDKLAVRPASKVPADLARRCKEVEPDLRRILESRRDRRRSKARRDSNASELAPLDPIDAIERLTGAALAQICNANGIGLMIGRDGDLTVYSNGRAWTSLIRALERNAGQVALALPGEIGITTAELRVIGPVLDAPPPPIAVVPRAPEPMPEWVGGIQGATWKDSATPDDWIGAALKCCSYQGWTSEQREAARARLTAVLEPGDIVTGVSFYSIFARKAGGESVEIRRFDA